MTFARTKAGEELLRSAVAAGVLETSPLEDLEVVNEMQPGQCMRKSAMHSFILAMRLARKQTPSYSLRQLACWQKRLPLARSLQNVPWHAPTHRVGQDRVELSLETGLNKYKSLAQNIVLFAVNSVATKLIAFVLVPLYTYYLSEGEYGNHRHVA